MVDLLEIIGTNFVSSRSQLITIILMILTGTLERNGLKEAAADLIRKIKGLTSGMLIAIWGVIDQLCIIFKIPITGNYQLCPSNPDAYDHRYHRSARL